METILITKNFSRKKNLYNFAAILLKTDDFYCLINTNIKSRFL